jgi:hypothetical protein
MFTATTLSILLQLQPEPPEPPPVREPFSPVRAEVTAVEKGVEILTYDDQGELIGALIATPDGDHGVRIEADFDDGYAMLRLSPDEPDNNAMQTDLEQTEAVGRVAKMFGLTVPSTGPLEASHDECMWIFAGIATICGSAALSPQLAGPLLLGECLLGRGGALCECGEYLPLDICP